jgi:hypothetical protein
MLLLLIRLPSQRRRGREPNKKPNQPPFGKPDREREQKPSAHIKSKQTTEAIANIKQAYHLERRLFL